MLDFSDLLREVKTIVLGLCFFVKADSAAGGFEVASATLASGIRRRTYCQFSRYLNYHHFQLYIRGFLKKSRY
jgi:hypothetical protein